MKSRFSAKLVIVCWVAVGLIVAGHHTVWGMNKADLVEKMSGEAGISKVATENAFYSNDLQAPTGYAVNGGTWLNHPPIVLGGPIQPVVTTSENYTIYWEALPPYNFLWPLWSPALSPVDAAPLMALPLVTESGTILSGSLMPVIIPTTLISVSSWTTPIIYGSF